jgi:threonine dehydrogenase-like Zn-dependent dehydrogenase
VAATAGPPTVLRLAGPRQLEYTHLARPTPGPGEVLVQVAAVSICGSDLSGYLGSHPRIRPPTILGHELSGRIAELGPGVEGTDVLAVGDRVCVDPTFGCGWCRHCQRGRKNVCREYWVLGESEARPGAFAGSVAVPAGNVHRLPDGVSDELGAIVQPLAVASHAVRHRAGVVADEVVLVLGAGAIGLGIMLAARGLGARTVVTDVRADRLRRATALGADAVVDAAGDPAEVERTVLDATDGYGADASFEAIGGTDPRPLARLVTLTARGGRIVVVGMKLSQGALPIADLKWGEKAILGSQAHPDSFPAVLAQLADGSLPAGPLVTHRFPWDQAPAAFDLLERGADGIVKAVVTAPG